MTTVPGNQIKTEGLDNSGEKRQSGGATPNNKSQKRKRQKGGKYDSLLEEYKAFSYTPLDPSGRPGSPHSFFESSYSAKVTASDPININRPNISPEDAGIKTNNNDNTIKTENDSTKAVEERVSNNEPTTSKESPTTLKKSDDTSETVAKKLDHKTEEKVADQVIHRHANGLCIVTAGTSIQKAVDEGKYSVVKVEFMKSAPDPQSIGGKRKKKAKMIKKNNGGNFSQDPSSAKPSDTLVTVTFSNGETKELKCCVLGTILELNTKIELPAKNKNQNNGDSNASAVNSLEPSYSSKKKVSLLISDPLLDGYLAVILPTGPFPFRNKNQI